jgi:hypothetical protein
MPPLSAPPPPPLPAAGDRTDTDRAADFQRIFGFDPHGEHPGNDFIFGFLHPSDDSDDSDDSNDFDDSADSAGSSQPKKPRRECDE